MAGIDKSKLDGFHSAAQSLKLYRRAELMDEKGVSLIDTLYVDPLPSDLVFKTMMKPNTTVLIGRKGTGKSTIFQRVQNALLEQKRFVSAYLDIKTVFESAQIDESLLTRIEKQYPDALSSSELQKLLLYHAFLQAVIKGVKEELEKRLNASFWNKIKEQFTGTIKDLLANLDELIETSTDTRFVNILALKHVKAEDSSKLCETNSDSMKVSAKLSSKPSVSAEMGAKSEIKSSAEYEQSYSDILMRVFNIKELISIVKDILNKAGIRHLFIFVDDFSELPQDAMSIIVDTLLAPLNNWSEEFIKFKIAAYPGRIYYGQIDKTKIDEIYLDIFKTYGTAHISDMESKAMDFTRRLVESRLTHFCQSSPEMFFEKVNEDLWRTLFYATMANPRNLGYILYFLYESNLVFGRLVGIQAIRDAAQKYYEEKIESYFRISKFLHESFVERSSIFSLKELLEAIVSRARELRLYRTSAVTKDIEGTPPTSHFHVLINFEELLLTLELNFFLTKYYEMSDRDGRKVSVFALNYGLCQKHSIRFGRPSGKTEYRLYFVERHFDFSTILKSYLQTNQEIVCCACQSKFDLEQLPALKMYSMKCPKCSKGVCEVINLSKKYDSMLKAINQNLLLPSTELGILETLHSEDRKMYAGEIAGELDCSFQFVGARGKIMEAKGLVQRSKNDQGRREFEITDLAENSYFNVGTSESLNISQDPADGAK